MKTLHKYFLLTGILFSLNSQALLITAGFTGAWYNADEPGQGILLQVLEGTESNDAMVIWFTFDPEGNQIWLTGLAPVEGDQVTVDLTVYSGGTLGPNGFNNTDIVSDIWGTMTLTFQNCNKGTASYSAEDTNVGGGSFTIKRLTRTVGSQCSGGTSDNNPPGASSDVQIDFVNTGADVDANGRLKFEQNSQFNQLKIWYKDLPEGDYQLLVDGEAVADLYAKAHGQSHQFFSSPQHENWLLLDFDVLGKTIEIAQDGVVYLSVDVPAE